ncbi:MAG: hypothetical protein CME31_19610 [Gimesia sp.]|uniref:Uncharacterized protein n=1 Tax=Gimesia maris TaxID=122 RepID=A0A3D3RC82_9PLAN|nr:hypothetical protein [Gimesia sp.]HCO26474.1 hypothetical protein [Gimesia maris]
MLEYDLTNSVAYLPLNQSGLTTGSNRSEPAERSTGFQNPIQNYACGESPRKPVLHRSLESHSLVRQ